jgi:hypothetical protein
MLLCFFKSDWDIDRKKMMDFEEQLILIRHRAKQLQNITPDDVEDIEYVVQIGAEIEELVDGLIDRYKPLH